MGRVDSAAPVYKDKLVQLFSNRIVLKNYYFPFGAGRTVPLLEIGNVEILTPTILTGKYRIWGSGNLTTWFPLDSGRNRREKIFLLTLSTQKVKIGFTVEDTPLFELGLKKTKII